MSTEERKDVQSLKKGLSKKDRNYRYNTIKGRIAETLIQELFLSLGYNGFHFGMKKTILGIIELLKSIRSDVAEQIIRMPNFVIQDFKSESIFFIKFKFMLNGESKCGFTIELSL